MKIRDIRIGPVDTRANWLVLCGIILSLASVQANADEAPLHAGYHLWTVQDRAPLTQLQSASTLRPNLLVDPAQVPKFNQAAGIGRHFDNGLSLNAGMALTQVVQIEPVNYRDYFFGFRYGDWHGKVWYLPETQASDEPTSLYYEAGWSQPVSDRLSLSLRLGQQQSLGPAMDGPLSDTPNLSFGAAAQLRGYGLGLRLMDTGGGMFGGEEDLSVMGSISKPFP